MGKKVIDDCNIANCPKDPKRLGRNRLTLLCSVCNRNVYNCSPSPSYNDWRRIAPFTDTLPPIHSGDVVTIIEGTYARFEATVDVVEESDQAARIMLNIFGMHVPFWISMRYLRRVAANT